jgi:16S rRNA (guanine(966)-N(2))-methyltransferase RsmD
MRVVAGLYRGRKVERLDTYKIRPTLDRVKESLFSILTPKILDTAVVDFFAGSGSLGIEALSRGAARAVFIDESQDCIGLITKNLGSLGVPAEQYQLIHAPAAEALKLLERKNAKFDLVFLDPPYGAELVPQTLRLLAASKILRRGVWVIAEHHKKEILPEQEGSLVLFRRKDYGDVALTFYKIAKPKAKK